MQIGDKATVFGAEGEIVDMSTQTDGSIVYTVRYEDGRIFIATQSDVEQETGTRLPTSNIQDSLSALTPVTVDFGGGEILDININGVPTVGDMIAYQGRQARVLRVG